MSDFKISHRIFIEESNDRTIIEESLQSKMSQINLYYGKTDILNAQSYNDIITNLKVASDILIKELMNQRKIANLYHFFVYEIESFITNRFESDQ